jgi:hypothetical protein
LEESDRGLFEVLSQFYLGRAEDIHETLYCPVTLENQEKPEPGQPMSTQLYLVPILRIKR